MPILGGLENKRVDSGNRSQESDGSSQNETGANYPYRGKARIVLMLCTYCAKRVLTATITPDRTIEEEPCAVLPLVGIRSVTVSPIDRRTVYVEFTSKYAADPELARTALARLTERLGVELTKAIDVPSVKEEIELLTQIIQFNSLVDRLRPPPSYFSGSRGFGYYEFPWPFDWR